MNLKYVDMTSGSILKRAAQFALPICISNIFQQLYSTVDTLVIGNCCDASALAAVATSSQPLEILLCVFLGIGSGISIMISQAIGSNDKERINKICSTAIFLLYAASIPLTILGIFAGPFLLRLMQVPEDAMPYAIIYLRITTIGILGNMGYNFNSGILRGLGNSSSLLLLLGISCAVNIVLDIVLTAYLGMGVTGVAIATSIALLLSWIFSIFYLRRTYLYINFTIFPRGFYPSILKEMLSIGIPLGLNTALYSIGHLVLQALYNTMGSVFVAGCSVAGKVSGIANIAITSYSSAATVFAGQNFGAKNYNRLCEGAWKIPLFSGLVTLIGGVIVTLFSRPLLALFSSDPAVLNFGQRYIYIVLPFTWAYAVFNGIMSFVNGIDEIRYPTVVNILLLWVVRIPVAYILMAFGYGEYAMVSISASFVTGMITMLFYFRTKRWKQIAALRLG